MATNQFLMIVTPDWTEMPPIFIDFVGVFGEDNLDDLINQGAFGEINEFVQDFGLLPVGETLDTMFIFSAGSDPDPRVRVRVWCKFKPLVLTY